MNRNPRWFPEYTGMKPSFNNMGAMQLNKNHPLNQGLVAWWLMNEGAGTSIFSTTQNYKGLANLTYATWVKTAVGPAFQTDSSTTQLGRTNFGNLDVLGDITIIAYLIPLRKSSGTETSVLGRHYAGSDYTKCAYLLAMNYASGPTDYYPFFQIAIGSSGYAVPDPAHTQFVVGTPIWLAGVRRNLTTLELWRNGIMINSVGSIPTGNMNTPAATPLSLGELTVGAYVNTYANYIYASIWNRALSPAEIARVYANPYGTPSNPVLLIQGTKSWFAPTGASPTLYANVIGGGVGASAPCVIGS
jgi:hypothetical protein